MNRTVSQIQVVSIMSWPSIYSFFPWIEKFILIWISSWNHLGVAREMFDVFYWQLYEVIPQNCRRKKLGDEVLKNWHKVEDMDNELDCDSND